MNIKNFINKKSLKIETVSGESLNDFLEKHNLLFKKSLLINTNRDFIFAIDEKDIVGFAILFRSDCSFTPLENVISLSNIEVNKNYKNKGIGSYLFEKVIEIIEKEKKILKRTLPTPEGETFIEEKFSRMLKEKKINYIPYNLSFLYERLSTNGFFTDKTNNQKISTMHLFEQEILKTPNLQEKEIKFLNQNFLDETDIYINNQKNLMTTPKKIFKKR